MCKAYLHCYQYQTVSTPHVIRRGYDLRNSCQVIITTTTHHHSSSLPLMITNGIASHMYVLETGKLTQQSI